MAISFPYKLEKVKNGFTYRPKIPITLSYDGKSIDVIGLVDSGSDVSVIPKGLAEYLGLELNGKSYEIEGVGGKKIETVNTFVNLTVQKGNERYHLRLPVRVAIKEEDQSEDIILGREVFFNEFDITFEENKKRVVLTKIRH